VGERPPAQGVDEADIHNIILKTGVKVDPGGSPVGGAQHYALVADDPPVKRAREIEGTETTVCRPVDECPVALRRGRERREAEKQRCHECPLHTIM